MKIVVKQPSEDMLVDFDCSSVLRAGEVITGITSITEATGVLTFPGASAISGQIVQNRVAGGVDKTTYKVTIVFVTDKSPTREADFYIKVREL